MANISMLPTTISGCITCAGNNLLIMIKQSLKNTPGTRTKRVPGVLSLFPEELFYELLLESFDFCISVIAFGSEVELDLRLGT